MENKQTAVQFLIEHIKIDAMYEAKTIDEWVLVFDRAKQMEKDQIMKANFDGFQHGVWVKDESQVISVEQYYNETYGTK
jgi:hypothetical protein